MTTPGATIDRICVTVLDLAQGEAFYRDALGFATVAPSARCNPDRAALLGVSDAKMSAVTMRLGPQHLELLAFDPPGRSYPADSTSSDLWFQHCALVVGDMAKAVDQLRPFGVHPITQGGPQTLPPNTGRVTAFKFRDPFGHPLELLRFPAGVGASIWHGPNPATFLGIDHTAIAVSDPAATAEFYRRLLGFRETSHSQNSGAEQSRLDAIPHDRVAVLALAPAHAPPHLELLGYQTGLRRPGPADRNPADVVVTRTIVTVSEFADVRQRLAGIDPPSPVRHGSWDGHPAFAVEDPDGHALIILAAEV